MKVPVEPVGTEGLACPQRNCTAGGGKFAVGYTDRVQLRPPASPASGV